MIPSTLFGQHNFYRCKQMHWRDQYLSKMKNRYLHVIGNLTISFIRRGAYENFREGGGGLATYLYATLRNYRAAWFWENVRWCIKGTLHDCFSYTGLTARTQHIHEKNKAKLFLLYVQEVVTLLKKIFNIFASENEAYTIY